jgi:choice-of-anchor B domain-containing protein
MWRGICATIAGMSMFWPTHQASAAEVSETQAQITVHSGDTLRCFCQDTVFQFIGPDTSSLFRGGTGAWGWTGPDGTEYALMGVYEGLVVVNASERKISAFIPGPQTNCIPYYWREIRTYQHYAYVVSECHDITEGLLVIDLSLLPDTAIQVGQFAANNTGLYQSHSLSIDTVKGFAYLEGVDKKDSSLYIHSLANPAVPIFIKAFGPTDVHDCQANNDTVWVAEANQHAFSIWEVSNKLSPQMIVRVIIPSSGFVHNIWPSNDRNYLVTTEETNDRTVKIWDVSDYSNISILSEWLGTSPMAHNAYWKGDKIYLSHYASGVYAVDVRDPSMPQTIANYITEHEVAPGIMGAWGAYPYTQSGTVYGSNIDGQLFLLDELDEPVYDTLWMGTTYIPEPGIAVVSVNLSNSHPTRTITLPVSYAGPFNLILDSISVAGTRSEGLMSGQWLIYDVESSQFTYRLRAPTDGSGPGIAPGRGPVLALYFTVPEDASGNFSPVRFIETQSHPFYSPVLTQKCATIVADTLSGSVRFGTHSCCINLRGNANGDVLDAVNVADVTYLVKFLFQAGTPPPCLLEADANGNGSTNIADVTLLVKYLFASGPAPASCP